jgi:hypothetical protein
MLETFLILRRSERNIILNMHGSSYKARYYRHILMKLEFFSIYFSKNNLISNFMKICPVEAKFHADGQTDRRDITELIVAFRNFSKAPKNESSRRGMGKHGLD